MILGFAENRCILGVLSLLNKGKSKYSDMFKETKVSHTTLQAVLKGLEAKKFIKKHDVGHMKVNYEITEKGRELLGILLKLKESLNRA